VSWGWRRFLRWDKVRAAREKGLNVRKVAAKYGLGVATVQRITTAA